MTHNGNIMEIAHNSDPDRARVVMRGALLPFENGRQGDK
jgi:hypothetical protein